MHRHRKLNGAAATLVALAFAAPTPPAAAIDGVIEINHSRAMAGGVTANDAPGYPVTIAAAGSYRLTGDLNPWTGTTDGILVTAADVTIDLNGFSIFGPTACTGTPPAPVVCTPENLDNDGINARAAQGLTVRNGVIRGMPNSAIECNRRCHIQRVRATDNGHSAFVLNGGSLIEDSHAEGNGGHGILADVGSPNALGCLIVGNSLIANGDNGVSFGIGSNVVANVVRGNGADGIQGHTGRVADNSVSGNENDGIHVVVGLVAGNEVRDTGDTGINGTTSQVGLAGNAVLASGFANLGVGAVQIGPNACGNVACP